MAATSEATLLTDQHRRRQVALAVTADSQMRRTWDTTLDPDNLEATQPIWKRAMLDTLTKWWHVSANTAAQYLPRFRQAEIGDGGIEVGIPRFDRALAGRQLEWGGMVNVLWHVAMGQTREAAYTAARELFLGMFHEAVLTGGRMTIQEWARRDSRAIGWRRVSDGNPCAFCAMLVSRGPVYTSEEHALTRQSDGQKFHPHCGCTVEVVYGDWKPDGREQQWVDDYYRAAESLPDKTPRTADTVLPIMRRSGHYRDSPKSESVDRIVVPHDPEERRILSLRGMESVDDNEWIKRKRAVGVDPATDILYPQETVFLEKFEKLGNHIKWIPRDTKNASATNDFLWLEENEECELKSMSRADYGKIADRISRAVKSAKQNHGIVKDCFIIDIGNVKTSKKLINQLSNYNSREWKIRRLFVMDGNGFKEIPLK